MFQPKLVIQDTSLEPSGSPYLTELQQALFTHFQRPYRAPGVPFSLSPGCENIPIYECKQCKDW